MLCQLGGKMKHTVESLKECMKVTEEEEKYRNEDFNVSELNYQNTKFTCTKCSKNLRSQIEGKQTLIVHPLLDVLLCKNCCDFYGDGDFSLDDEGEDKYCRWCGRGGTLFTCSKCICAFCNRCIKKHFGVNILKKITEDDNWVCYFCNPKPLWYLRSICWLAKKINAKVVEKSNNVSSKEHILDTSDSVDSDESTNTRQRFRLKRSLRSSKQITYSKCRLSSSEEEKENKVNERSRRNKIKAQIFETDEDETPGTARKRKKVSNDVEEGSEETKQIVNRNLVIEKFKEIWKMLLITTEVGLKWSKNRLEILSNPDRGKIIDDLGKEYKHLQSVAAMLSSSISKATDSIEALKDDLTCKNVKDDRDVLQNEAVNIKALAKKLLDSSGETSFPQDEHITHQFETKRGTHKSIELEQKKRKQGKEIGKSKPNETSATQTENESSNCDSSPLLSCSEGGVEVGRNLTTEEATSTPKDEPPKPMLKVKSFARMTYDNLFDKKPNTLQVNVERASGSNKADENGGKIRNGKNKTSSGTCDSRENGPEKSDSNSEIEMLPRRRRLNVLPSDDDIDEINNTSNSDSKKRNRSSETRSSSTSEGTRKVRKKKRKRKNKNNVIQSDEEIEENISKHRSWGRRNIKPIMKARSLEVDTKEAEKNEQKRKNRIMERTKLMKEMFPEDFNADGTAKRLVLDFDPETKQPIVSVNKELLKVLKPHQINGVKFMWDNCFESVQRLQVDGGSGCILAHCMGLGKTLEVITLVHTIFTNDIGVNTVLIICPLSTVTNWLKEFKKWLKELDTEPIPLYALLQQKKRDERIARLNDWSETGGVLIISYDLLRTLTRKPPRRLKNTKHNVILKTLLDPGPDLVVCDEGHILRNISTSLSKCVNLINTSRRIVLTGTPLQNNLMEYHCMVQFVKPNLLGTRKEFSNRFANPINNGQFEDSTADDVKVMKKRSHVLHTLLSGCVQRCDYSVMMPYLPEKHEYVLSISLTEMQTKLYRHFIDYMSSKQMGTSKSSGLFNDYQNLHRIWTHPRAMLLHHQREMEKFNDFINDESESSIDSEQGSTTTTSSRDSQDAKTTVPRGNTQRRLRSNTDSMEWNEEESTHVTQWWSEYCKESDYDDLAASNKLKVLFTLLKLCEERGDKVLVFSQSLYTLDIIEHFLNLVDEKSGTNAPNKEGFNDTWVLGVDYFRLDGCTKSDLRSIWCENFNKDSNQRARLFLISTGAGGLGINLHAANRVVVFDASWNPSNDLQSIFRVYRFGQKKVCYIYRFLAEATMEEKIYKRQVTKLSLAHRVVDEQQIERHYSMLNLQELYNFEPTPKDKRQTPKVPTDKILANLLVAYKDEIVGYHEHDSLLENQEEENLTEDERRAAWQEFQDEQAQKEVGTSGITNLQVLQMQMGVLPYPSGSHVINPTLAMPLELFNRGLAINVVPYYATSLKEMDVIESSLWFEMIERFVRSKDYNPLLGLKILANAMYTRLVEPELKKEKNCVTPTESLPVQGGDSGSDTTINSEKVETVSQKSYKSADHEISCSEKRQQNGIGDIQIAGEQTGTNSFDLSNNKEQTVTSNTSECNLFKKQFFSSDSDDSSIDMNLTETKTGKLESEESQIQENSKKRKEPKNECKERDEDDEIGKLQSLLRQVQVSMTEGSGSNKSNGGIKKPAKQNRMKKSNTAEESLLDFMNDNNKQVDNCLELEVVQEMSKEKDENFNALIKSTFLLSSDENAASSDDEDPEKPRPKKKLTVNSKGKAESVDSHDERIVRKRNSLPNFNFSPERGAMSVSDFDDDSESFTDSDDFSNNDNKKSRVDRKEKNKVSESGEVLHNFSSYDSSDSDIQHVSTVKRHENENLNDNSIGVENKNTETKKEEIFTEKKFSSNPPQSNCCLVSDLDPAVTEELIVVEDNHHSPIKKNLESPGRRNINKILTKSSLELSTKQARKMEKERNKRLAAKQNMLAEISSCQPDSSSRLILDFDPVTMKELVVVDKNLTSRLKPHQKAGVKFMWDACFESLQRLKEDSGSGCILAHCMGLGKTLQVITLVHTLFSHDTGVKSAMILCPLNTVRNWLKEFRTWLQKCHVSVAPFEIITCKTQAEKLKKISQWKRRGGVFVVSYEMFRSMTNMNKSEYEPFYPALCDPGPDLVICDEGHLLKNTKTALSKCVSRIRTLRRIVLTGTPLQNNLIEYYCMIHFVKPNILGTMKEFLNGFVNPIKNGQFEDSTTNDVILMKKRAHVLHSLLGGFVQRFGYNVLTPFLPEKYEYVISICLTPTQDRLYRMFINKCTKVEGLLQDFHWLQKVWTHPKIMINAAEQQNESEKINDMRRKEHWLHMVEPNEYNNLRSSGKLVILFKILKSCRKIGDKILIFSQYLSTLNLIEYFLRKANDEYGKCPQNEFVDTWVFGEDYFRIDGSTNSSTRYDYCKKFNDVKNQRSRVLLISTKAGGMGINLIGANRVVIFDVSWNPSHDVQSIFRVYRFGQVKPCYIYRFIAEATMEEKIYKRQVNKLSLAHRIVDEHQIERHYSMMNLQELYNYDPAPKDKWRIPIVPKDCLFAELLASSRDIVVNYHEHDTLLENKEEEELTEEERRAAWEDFEKERFQSQTIENDNLVHLYDMPHNSTFPLNEEHNDMISNDSQNKMCKIVEVRTLINHQAVQAGEDDISLVKNLPLIEE